MARYWLVKCPDEATSGAMMELLSAFKGDKLGTEVVEIMPEHRDANWMEIAIAAKFADPWSPQ